MLRDMLSQSSLTLREMQVAAGRIMRCIMTFPPGAGILVAGLFALTVGLTLPWHLPPRRVRGVAGLQAGLWPALGKLWRGAGAALVTNSGCEEISFLSRVRIASTRGRG